MKWEDINYEHRTIRICRSEKNSRLKKERYISSAKNDKIRVIPLTDDMARVLRKVKEFEFKNGWLGEYVFKMTGEECMLQEYQTVQLITQEHQNSITRKVSMLSEEH